MSTITPDMEYQYECPVCSEWHDTFAEARECYRSHPASKAINRVVGDKRDVNLVELVKRHGENARDGEYHRLYVWLHKEKLTGEE